MNKLVLGILVLLLAHGSAFAQSASDASIRRLLEVTESRKLIDGMFGQLDQMMQSSVRVAIGDTKLSQEQRQIIEESQAEVVALFQREMGWAMLEPMMIEIYRTHFSEAEIQGMLQFYESDVGRSMVAKMPAAMQSSMEMTQTRMAALIPKIQEIQRKSLARLQELCKDGDSSDCTGTSH